MDPDLNLDAPWSIGEQGFQALCTNARAVSPRTIVEFGSGRSSVRLALAFPNARVLSVDHSPIFGGRTRELAHRHGLSDCVEVSVRPLRWQIHGGALYQTYEPGIYPPSVDMVLVDGPPGRARRGREACLYQVLPSVRLGGRVYLDNYKRPAEQHTVRNWHCAYPGVFRTSVLAQGHDICMLEKIALAPPLRPRPSIVLDVTLANLRRVAGWTWRRIRHDSAPLT